MGGVVTFFEVQLKNSPSVLYPGNWFISMAYRKLCNVLQCIHISCCLICHTCLFLIFQSDQMSRLVKIPGIVIACSAIKSKAVKLAIQCRSCANVMSNIQVKPGLEGYALPRKCNT